MKLDYKKSFQANATKLGSCIVYTLLFLQRKFYLWKKKKNVIIRINIHSDVNFALWIIPFSCVYKFYYSLHKEGKNSLEYMHQSCQYKICCKKNDFCNFSELSYSTESHIACSGENWNSSLLIFINLNTVEEQKYTFIKKKSLCSALRNERSSNKIKNVHNNSNNRNVYDRLFVLKLFCITLGKKLFKNHWYYFYGEN